MCIYALQDKYRLALLHHPTKLRKMQEQNEMNKSILVENNNFILRK